MKNRLFDNWVTTAVGAAVLIFAGYMAQSGNWTSEESMGWIVFGVTMLRTKDTIIGIKHGKDAPQS